MDKKNYMGLPLDTQAIWNSILREIKGDMEKWKMVMAVLQYPHVQTMVVFLSMCIKYKVASTFQLASVFPVTIKAKQSGMMNVEQTETWTAEEPYNKYQWDYPRS